MSILGTSSKHFIRVLFVFSLILFGGIFLGVWVVYQIIPNAEEVPYAHLAGATMFLISFLCGMVAWQGIEILRVILWIVGKILTLGISKITPPSAIEKPPSIWKLITVSAIVCGLVGLLLGLNSADIKILSTTFDFFIAGACWGLLLFILGNMGWLPHVERDFK